MPTQILRPTSTDLNEWVAGRNYDYIDDNVVKPNAGDGLNIMASEMADHDNKTYIVGFGTIDIEGGTVTNITVYTYGRRSNVNNPEVDINMGGWQGEQECSSFGESPDWGWTDNNSFDGNWNQADLDGLQVKYIADVPLSKEIQEVDVCYVVVTYEAAPVGYGHDFIGVPATNIGEVCGVPTANIDKIIGV